MTIKVGVIGAAGRMGRAVCKAVSDDPELQLVAAIAPNEAGQRVSDVIASVDSDVVFSADLAELTATECSVVVEFTHLQSAMVNLEFCASNGLHCIVGTSGFSDADVEKLNSQFTSSNCLIAPNFAIGAVLLMRFAELAAPYFETAEIIEFHHEKKIDSPSGTAIHTANAIAAASDDWLADPTTTENIPGSRGAKGAGGIPIHSVRMRGMTAHEEIVFGAVGQSMTLRHDSYDRTSFMPGVVLACKKVADTPGVVVGLHHMLDL